MSRSILSGCITKPKNYNPNYPPAVAGGEAYVVKEGESFASIAARLAPRYGVSTGTMAKMLLHHNFGTSLPEEVNFYLQRNLGCERLTLDRKNYVFTPGQIIYLPPLKAIPKELEGTGLWFGIGVQTGGIVGIGGAQTVTAQMISLESGANRRFKLIIGPKAEGSDQLNRVGIGLGGGVGTVLVIVSSLFENPLTELHELPSSEPSLDINISLGKKWSKVAASPRMARLAPLLEKAAQLAKRYPRAGKYMKPEQLEELIGTIQKAIAYGLLNLKLDDAEPNVEVLPLPIAPEDLIPVPTALELSVGYSWGYCKPFDYVDSTGVTWKRPAAKAPARAPLK